MVKVVTLKNGLRLAVEEIPYVRGVSMGVWVKNGSRNETEQTNGISHFIEHMLFKGTDKRSARDIAEEMDMIGGQINAYTAKEYTCFHTRSLDKHFGKALDILSDMFLNSTFAQKDIDKERGIIEEEINMYEDSPEDKAHDALYEGVWQGSPLAMPILGSKKSISGFNSEILKEYKRNNYTAQNTVIAVAGNVKNIEPLVENAFDGFISPGSRQSVLPAVYTPCVVVNQKDAEQLHICLSFKGFKRESEYKYPLAALNSVLGGGISSRLFQKIREEKGLTYSIYSYLSSYTDNGLFSVYAAMSKKQAEKVFGVISKELKSLKADGITQKELDITKEQLISAFIIGGESVSGRMSSIGGSVLLNGSVKTQDEVIANIEKISLDDVKNVIDKIFTRETLSISAAGNAGGLNFEKLRDIIEV